MRFKRLRKFICKIKGHNFETYIFRYGIWSDDIEQAGFCIRCGYDTHETKEDNQ